MILVDEIPQTEQAHDESGKLLYWSHDIEDCLYSDDGYPWKTNSGKKIYITYDKTDYPITIYKYSNHTIKSNTIDDELGLQNRYYFGNQGQYGKIEKSDNEFKFSMLISGTECGIKVKVDPDTGDLTGHLIGVWEGINDISAEERLTKLNAKEFLYTNQDLNTYVSSISLNTSNKVGWYLMNDTSNQVYSSVQDGQIPMNLAVVRTNPTNGNPITSMVTNIYNKQLYWTSNMSTNGSISGYGYPLKNGVPVFMTTEPTKYPVYAYVYDIIELLKFDYSLTNGIEQTFSDASGNQGKLFVNTDGIRVEYKPKTSGSPAISLVMNGTQGTLNGDWKVIKGGKTFNLVPELPEVPNDLVKPMLSVESGKVAWVETPTEKHKLVNLNGESSEVVSIVMEHQTTHIISLDSGNLDINVTIPNVPDNTVIRDRILVTGSDITLTWGDNIIGSDSDKEVDAEGNTEFILTCYKGFNESKIYIKKV